jgi:hypothetical protein
MKFSFAKKAGSPAAEIAALKSQLENARRRITTLTLENIQQANEISMLQDYRGGTPAESVRPMVMIGREITIPTSVANSEIGILFSAAAG